jgi:hypothetical protein
MEKESDKEKNIINNEDDLSDDIRMNKIEALLQENLEMNKEMKIMIRHINTYVAWQRIFAWLKLLLILISLSIGFIYLPPLFENLYQQAISFMSGGVCQ